MGSHGQVWGQEAELRIKYQEGTGFASAWGGGDWVGWGSRAGAPGCSSGWGLGSALAVTIYPMESKQTKCAAGTGTVQERALLLEGRAGTEPTNNKGEDDTWGTAWKRCAF